MTFSEIKRMLVNTFQRQIKNIVSLGNDSTLESDFKPLKVGGKNTPIEISETEVKVNRLKVGNTTITKDEYDVGEGDFTLDVAGDVTLSAAGGDVTITSADVKLDAEQKLYFDGGTETYMFERVSDSLVFVPGGDYMLMLDEANDKITMAATNWVAGTVSGASITEFSAANSAYAGMILGYTCIGADAADDSYTLTTSLSSFEDSGGTRVTVTFKTPPSELVEIEVSLFFSAGGGASDLILSLSDNAVYAANSLDSPLQHEKRECEPARGNGGTIVQKWLLKAASLAAVGSSNTIYIIAACDSTSGTPIIKWGGDATDEFTNLYMKATALPATIVEGS